MHRYSLRPRRGARTLPEPLTDPEGELNPEPVTEPDTLATYVSRAGNRIIFPEDRDGTPGTQRKPRHYSLSPIADVARPRRRHATTPEPPTEPEDELTPGAHQFEGVRGSLFIPEAGEFFDGHPAAPPSSPRPPQDVSLDHWKAANGLDPLDPEPPRVLTTAQARMTYCTMGDKYFTFDPSVLRQAQTSPTDPSFGSIMKSHGCRCSL